MIAAPGEANVIAITPASGLLTVTDTGSIAVNAGLGCTQAAANRVTCSTAGVSSISVDAGDGNDTVTLAGVTLAATLVDGPGDDAVTGGSGNDTFVGGAGNDTLTGGPGNDGFGDAGGAGADTLTGGSGTDTADYSSRTVPLSVRLDDVAGDGAAGESDDVRTDVETVNGGSAPDALVGSPTANTLRGNGGEDRFDGRGGADSFAGGSGQDTVDYSSRTAAVAVTLDGKPDDGEDGELDNVGTDVDVVLGGEGDDTITGHGSANELSGNGGADALDGGGGDDVLDGGSGDDDLDGGSGTDAVDYSSRTTPVVADLGERTGFGEAGEDDTVASDVEGVYGGSADDRLSGDGGANVLRGYGGDDVLDGRAGADYVSGGDGIDSVSYATREANVSIRLDNDDNDGQSGEGDDIRSDVEHLAGGRGDDKIYADDDANVITGNGGNDAVYGYGGNDSITLSGGNDKLSGGDGNDTLDAGAGDDSGDAGGGNDKLSGGDGNDNLSGGDGIDWLDGAAGNDKLYGAGGNDNVDGGSGDDFADGGAGEDQLRGGVGRDTLNGGDGNDVIEGGTEDDNLNGSRGADVLAGGDGNDKVSGSDDADTLGGGAGDDQVWGGYGDDVVGDVEGSNRLYGEDGNDRVTAGGGADSLSGGSGDDLVDAGAGDDLLNGDSGNDRLQGGDGADKLWGGSGDDVLDGGLGPDQMDGADGTDTVDYGGRTTGVAVTNDGKADDGQKGEGDNVATSIDNAIGSSGADRITFATDWPHKLDGGDGDDLLRGGPRDDALTGGRGADMLFGEGGKDTYDGGAGADHLSGADGVGERLLCGTGKDRGVLDQSDTAAGCEKRTVKKVSSSPAPAAPSKPVKRPSAPATKPSTKPLRAPSGLAGVRRATGRGRFVALAGSPGVRIDRRIRKDVAWILKRYRVRITAGYELSGHAINGEHPLGLALDIVPGVGGSWDDVDRLARWAEPRQNYPRPPFRWVGYNGDVNHGRGNHLHLSWMHASSRPGRAAAWVVTMKFRSSGARATTKRKRRSVSRGAAGALVRYARTTNAGLGKPPSIESGVKPIARCQGARPLEPALKAASRAFGLSGWRILAALTETESAFGCNMGPSSAGAIGWTQFMPATWSAYGMDANGDGKADPYDSVDAVFSSARYLRASGAPGSWRRALYAYNHSWAYVNTVLARSKKY